MGMTSGSLVVPWHFGNEETEESRYSKRTCGEGSISHFALRRRAITVKSRFTPGRSYAFIK